MINLCLLILGESCSQSGLSDIMFENTLGRWCQTCINADAEEKGEQEINTYDDISGVCKAVSNVIEYIPACNLFCG